MNFDSIAKEFNSNLQINFELLNIKLNAENRFNADVYGSNIYPV